MLENYGRRLYSSFTDAQNFWAYYSRFQGKRCFYWINRSFKVPIESSLLHFDLEWYTPLRDPKASEKLDTICTAINCALPSPVRILRENLSRVVPNNLFYNSYHLYALVTLEHNAQGCMRTFVINNIWPRLRDRPDMWCGRKKRPIMDLTIYTMNRPFRVPGSSKYDDYHPLPLPSRQLFTDTRMADRRTPPDLSTKQLNISKLVDEQPFHLSKNNKRSSGSHDRKIKGSCTVPTALSFMQDTKTPVVSRKLKRRRILAATDSEVSNSASASEAKKMESSAPKGWRVAGPTPGPYQEPKNQSKFNKSCPQKLEKPDILPIEAVGEGPSTFISGMETDDKPLGRILCPVTGCKNNYGRGYIRSYFIYKHIHAHNAILTQSAEEREKVSHALSEYGNNVLCKGCCRVVAQTNANWLCGSCNSLSETGKVSPALSDRQRNSITESIRSANRTRLRVLTEVPKSLRRSWSDCVATTLLKFSVAKTDEESFLALESWVKLKSVLVLPLKSGKRRTSSNRKFHSEQMRNWMAGNEDVYWQKANDVEQERQRLFNKKKECSWNELNARDKYAVDQNSFQKEIGALSNEQKRKFKRVKNLLNVGEVSKAMSALLSNGIAKVDDQVLNQLKEKHPPRSDCKASYKN